MMMLMMVVVISSHIEHSWCCKTADSVPLFLARLQPFQAVSIAALPHQWLFLIICQPLFPLLATTGIVLLIRVEEIALSSANVTSIFLTTTTAAAESTDRLNSRHLI